MIQIAERNLSKARRAYDNNVHRSGITEVEKENLSNNIEYAQKVLQLIVSYM